MLSKKIYDVQNRGFDIFIFISWMLYFAVLLGVSVNAPSYLDNVDYYAKIYVSLFLLYRFNMFRKITFTDLDRKIVFSAGLFLFATTALNELLTQYLDPLKAKISSILPKSVNQTKQDTVDND
jgi:hypothetical protein